MNRRRPWVREPVLHFLLLGALLFVLWRIFGAGSQPGGSIRIDTRTLPMLASTTMPADSLGAWWRGLSSEERQELVARAVRNEVLVREARALGLDENDGVIRQRLVDRMLMLQSDILAAALPEPTEAELQRHFERHAGDYRMPPSITFAHVFFDNRNGGRQAAMQRALRTRDSLESHAVPFMQAHTRGDPYLYQPNYVQRSPELVARHFNASMADSLFAMPWLPRTWRGPLESPFGQHLVWIEDRVAGRPARLDEVRPQVLEDLRRQRLRQATTRAVDSLVARYRVEIDLPIGATDNAGP